MSEFMSNFRRFIENKQYKQKFISTKAGIEENKLSRLLNGKQEPTEQDMQALSEALDQEMVFFLNGESERVLQEQKLQPFSFYFGESSQQHKEIASALVEFAENVDVVLGMMPRMRKSIKSGDDTWI